MTPDLQPLPYSRQRGRAKLWLALAVVLFLIALVIVPPLLSVSRYKSRITQLMSASLGRPVRLSSAEIRMLPRPGFVFTDLIVEEDPAYGAEPVLRANTVTASIRLLPLWRGRLEISRVSVDEASFNLVHAGEGRWNLDSLFRTAAPRPGNAGGPTVPLPYIEATSSRINIKNGAEKLPYSLLNTDLSFWQESTGEWRIRLRGQPARTDVSLDLPDTGTVRLEASLRGGPSMLQMPLHVDLDWREVQFGQLSRLIIGSDPGWRGDLTAELHLDGTAQAADVKTRLRASGLHRAEFTPASPIDFDATCAFVYHHSDHGVQDLACDSPVGNGRARLTGQLPGQGEPRFTVELDHVPAQIGLDALRTLRSGLDPGLEAEGSVSGKVSYDRAADREDVPKPAKVLARGKASTKARPPAPGPFTGSFIAEGLQLTGDGLSKPVLITGAVIEPQAEQPGEPSALVATIPVPAGGPSPLNVSARLGLHSYKMGLKGTASLARLREFARVAGITDLSLLESLAGEPPVLDLTAEGPWLSSGVVLHASQSTPASSIPPNSVIPETPDRFSGTVTFHNANWKAPFLANPVEISGATLHLENGGLRWDPVAFSYGPVKGTATLELPHACEVPKVCLPQFSLDFDTLDAGALQAAILGAREPGTLITSLIARLKPASASVWPPLQGSVQAKTLILAPVTFNDITASIDILPTGAEFSSIEGGVFGGHIHANGSLAVGDKPVYKLEGTIENLDAADVGQLFAMHWSGGAISGGGSVQLAGFTDRDLATSAKGKFHFDWEHGSIADSADTEIPPAVARFDRWAGDASIANGGATVEQSQVRRGSKRVPIEAGVTFGDPPRLAFTPNKSMQTSQR
jgi:hypothetical protein